MVGSYTYSSEECTSIIFGVARSNMDTQREMTKNEEKTKMNFIRVGLVLIGLRSDLFMINKELDEVVQMQTIIR